MGINQVIKEKSYKFQVSSYKLAEPEDSCRARERCGANHWEYYECYEFWEVRARHGMTRDQQGFGSEILRHECGFRDACHGEAGVQSDRSENLVSALPPHPTSALSRSSFSGSADT